MYQDRQNTFFLSLVSIWEIQIKLQLGKLTFDIDLQKVITEQLNAGYIEILSIKSSTYKVCHFTIKTHLIDF